MNPEQARLDAARETSAHRKRWGPYLSERAWGTVREDYSEHGTAWEFLPHDAARSKAYRWNEDGIAGIGHVLDGTAMLVSGGRALDVKPIAPGELRGNSLEGGDTRQLKKGPKHAHNFAWGDEDGKTLYMTARSAIYKMRLNIAGSGVGAQR